MGIERKNRNRTQYKPDNFCYDLTNLYCSNATLSSSLQHRKVNLLVLHRVLEFAQVEHVIDTILFPQVEHVTDTILFPSFRTQRSRTRKSSGVLANYLRITFLYGLLFLHDLELFQKQLSTRLLTDRTPSKMDNQAVLRIHSFEENNLEHTRGSNLLNMNLTHG
jgi:hypothetical protein